MASDTQIASRIMDPDRMHLHLREGTPWSEHRQRYDIELNQWVTVAQDDALDVVDIRKLAASHNDIEIQNIIHTKLHHANILRYSGVFREKTAYYLISEHVEIRVEDIRTTIHLVDEKQLAAIALQVRACYCRFVEPIMNITGPQWDRFSLVTAPGIGKSRLFHHWGDMGWRLNPESCVPVDSDVMTPDIRRLGHVMTQLMNPVQPEAGVWVPSGNWSQNAERFVSRLMESADLPASLIQDPFLETTRREELAWIVPITLRMTWTPYRITEWHGHETPW
ncbi:uncharacterized protein TRUGW13939_08804 [Talaromyces rugulosus]|uniref:Uncharacterized protein n=1 Tax=Talaromyces rugulosus TaxID=121627 RepID=A0A7H8R5L4_TALRU|nr:uncharacterized protein TRUGW13939_08804 [Talaromyces rugulosus]QKX61652.1 hypothetical protein TRUGW13939_08804 [Talaromyces rugulosus]